MRPFSLLPKSIRFLLISNVVVFFLGFLSDNLNGTFHGLFALINPFDVFVERQTGAYHHTVVNSGIYQVWRLFSYAFLHGDFWHLFFNMWTLWLFGSCVCDVLGERKFVGLYVFSGIFAALFSLPFYYFGIIHAPIIGASGALMGIYWAFFRLFPEMQLYVFFVLPVKMKYFIWVVIAMDIFSSRSADGIAHYTHLGGFLAGAILMFFYNGGFRKLRTKAESARGPKFRMHEGGRSFSNETPYEEPKKSDQPLEGEVFYVDEQKRMDEILKKVSKDGINSLTETERQFLLQAGDKLRRRRGGF